MSQLENDIHIMESRWKSGKASKRALSNDEEWIELDCFLSDCCKLKERHKELQKNCTWLGMKNKDLVPLESIHKDILCHKQANETMVIFKQEQRKMFAKKWRGFNLKHLYTFLAQWKLRIEELRNTSFYDNISKKIASLDKSISVLKYCCGDAYKDEHWAELLHEILCMPEQISLKEVTLNDFMEASDKLLLPSTITSAQKLQRRYVFVYN